MANRIPFGTLVNFGASGSSYGSEILINVPVGPRYFAASSEATLCAQLGLPGWVMFSSTQLGAVQLQYTPDSGTTWRTTATAGSGSLLYIDTTGSMRMLGVNVANLYAVPVKV
jgi:hypothetical protein